MNKRVFLLVGGSDYSAMDFGQNYNAQEFYEDMVLHGKTMMTINTDKVYADVKIIEFNEIDNKFISFIRNEIMDYDRAKDKDFFEVKPMR